MKAAVFIVANKEYAVDIEHVCEVISMRKIVPVPDTPGFVEGVISLRGKAIPLISMRKKLGIQDEPVNPGRIIITQFNNHRIGIVVDSVSGVVLLRPGQITPPDDVLKEARYLIGISRIEKNLVLVLDIEKLLSSSDKKSIKEVHERVVVMPKGK